MSKVICIADFTGIVHCDSDWTPNHVEHVQRGKTVKGVTVETPSELSGYVRIETDKGDYLLVNTDDWVIQ